MTDRRLDCLEVRLPNRNSISDIHPAARRRDWMDASVDSFAYRCIPLTIANQLGWEIRCPTGFTATWNGEDGIDGVEITGDDGSAPPADSHFGQGIVTFAFSLIFRTEPGTALWASGPANLFKDGAQALSGVIETDWIPFTFSMNWKLTRPGLAVRFEKDEPICQFFPIQLSAVEACQPTLRPLTKEDPEYRPFHQAFLQRSAKGAAERMTGRKTKAPQHQRWYMRGEMPDGSPAPAPHRNTLDVKPFQRSDE